MNRETNWTATTPTATKTTTKQENKNNIIRIRMRIARVQYQNLLSVPDEWVVCDTWMTPISSPHRRHIKAKSGTPFHPGRVTSTNLSPLTTDSTATGSRSPLGKSPSRLLFQEPATTRSVSAFHWDQWVPFNEINECLSTRSVSAFHWDQWVPFNEISECLSMRLMSAFQCCFTENTCV